MVDLTILNTMASSDFSAALERHHQWGMKFLDLKDWVFGKRIVDLTEEEAPSPGVDPGSRALRVLLFDPTFRTRGGAGRRSIPQGPPRKVDHTIEIARILQPDMIRLLAAQTTRRAAIDDSVAYLKSEHPWALPLYAEGIDRIHEAGFHILGNPTEVLDFFAELDRPDKVSFTWDVQNLWELGTFPSLDAYQAFRHLVHYYHLKGGQHNNSSADLCWRSSLEDASWPVVDITRQVVADGATPVICLNGSHGEKKDGYDYTDIVQRDMDFIRSAIPEIA